MPVIFAFFVGVMLILYAQEGIRNADATAPREVAEPFREARSQMALLGAFALVAQKAQEASPFASSTPATRTWSDLKTLATGRVPEVVLNAPIPSDWKVVGTNTEWVMCTPVNDATASLLPSRGLKTSVYVASNKTWLYTGDVNDAQKIQYASWCN